MLGPKFTGFTSRALAGDTDRGDTRASVGCGAAQELQQQRGRVGSRAPGWMARTSSSDSVAREVNSAARFCPMYVSGPYHTEMSGTCRSGVERQGPDHEATLSRGSVACWDHTEMGLPETGIGGNATFKTQVLSHKRQSLSPCRLELIEEGSLCSSSAPSGGAMLQAPEQQR